MRTLKDLDDVFVVFAPLLIVVAFFFGVLAEELSTELREAPQEAPQLRENVYGREVWINQLCTAHACWYGPGQMYALEPADPSAWCQQRVDGLNVYGEEWGDESPVISCTPIRFVAEDALPPYLRRAR